MGRGAERALVDGSGRLWSRGRRDSAQRFDRGELRGGKCEEIAGKSWRNQVKMAEKLWRNQVKMAGKLWRNEIEVAKNSWKNCVRKSQANCGEIVTENCEEIGKKSGINCGGGLVTCPSSSWSSVPLLSISN